MVDTNIFISAFGWEGKPRLLLKRIINGEFELFISEKQLLEIKKVLGYPKFNFSEEQKERLISILLQISTLVETTIKVDIIKEDISDNMLLECAFEANAHFIISGDNHLKNLKYCKNVSILSVDEFLKQFP